MIDFESYLRKVNTSKEFKVGDKVKFLRKNKPYKEGIFTIKRCIEIYGLLFLTLEETLGERPHGLYASHELTKI